MTGPAVGRGSLELTGNMALFTGHGLVHSDEREHSLVMIEGRRSPDIGGVTAHAVLTELAY